MNMPQALPSPLPEIQNLPRLRHASVGARRVSPFADGRLRLTPLSATRNDLDGRLRWLETLMGL
jgi:hypothetical protein